MQKITQVQVLNDYRLELTFDDGISGIVNLSDLVGKGVLLCGKIVGRSSRFRSAHPANSSGATRLICAPMHCI